MARFLVTTAAEVIFLPTTFGNVISFSSNSARMQSSQNIVLIQSYPVVLYGDENLIQVVTSYTATPPHTTPGSGILTLMPLTPAELSTTVQIMSKSAVALSPGQTIVARFQVTTPATTPNGAPDPLVSKIGRAAVHRIQAIVSG